MVKKLWPVLATAGNEILYVIRMLKKLPSRTPKEKAHLQEMYTILQRVQKAIELSRLRLIGQDA